MQPGSQNLGAKTVMIQARIGEGTRGPPILRPPECKKSVNTKTNLSILMQLHHYFFHTPGTAENLYLHKYIVLYYITTLG